MTVAKRLGNVTPVRTDARTMGNWDLFATWVGANANNGTWYIGGVIAAAGMLTASTTLILTGIVSYILLGLASYMGYRTGMPAMALTRPAFGLRGSFIPSIINVVQFIGWAAANTFIAAISISVIFKDLLGWPAYGTPGGNRGLIVGILIMSVLHMASISLGERSVRMIERVGIVLVMLLVIWESVVVFQHASLSQILAWRPAGHFKMTSGAAVDVLAAFNLAWVTAAADFSRFGKSRGAATTWSFLGANLGLFWFAFIGLTATIAAAITSGVYDPNSSDPSTIATKLGLGILALLVIVITSTTANAVNLMAAGSAVTNMFHRLKLTPALWLVTIVATAVSFVPLVFTTFLAAFTAFLDMIGMFLGPEIAVFLVDFFILRRREYDADAMTRVDGQYWYRGGFNLIAIASWAIGVALYFGLRHVPFIANTVGATFVGMALTAGIYYVGMRSALSKQ
jgi:NCS1 family nucleobase:cation symporter-1